MIDVLRDAIWQFVGVILALIALLVTVWIYRKQKTRKLVVWDARSIVPLLSVDKALEDKLQITFRGHAVTEAYMANIMLSNCGNMPITRQDYDEPLTLLLSGSGEVVSLDVTSNTSTEVVYRVDEHGRIHIDPFLLNP
jgi:hypothetical protein